MIGTIRRLASQTFNAGLDADHSEHLNKSIWICNMFGVSLGLVVLPYSLVFHVAGSTPLGLACVPVAAFYLMMPLFNAKGWTGFSRVSFVVMAHLVVFSFAVLLGPRANIHFLFGLTIFYGLFFYTPQERVKRGIALTLAIGSAVGYIAHMTIWSEVRMPLSEGAYDVVSGLILFTVMGLLYLVSYYFRRSTAVAEKKVAEHLDELEALVVERTATISKSDALQKAILESMDDGVLVVSASGRISQNNRRFVELWEVPEEAMASRHDATVMDAVGHRLVEPDAFKARVAEIYASDEVAEDDVFLTDGTCLARYSCPLIRNGIPDGRIWLFRDVTARRKMEEVMLHSEKMASVGVMAAGVAHEINNPLAGIIQNTQVIQRRLMGDLDKSKSAAQKVGVDYGKVQAFLKAREVDRMLDNVVGAGHRASEIVGNMLTFARKGSELVAEHDVLGLLEESIAFAGSDYDLKKNYDFKRVRIEKSFQSDLPPLVCFGSKLQQVFLNILVNGAQAMQDAQVPDPHFLLEANLKKSRIVVKITNYGSIIPEEVKRKVFEPFFTTKGVGEGTGLGLSVSYFIITEDHGGKIYVESSEEEGTCFTIELPLDHNHYRHSAE